MQLLLETHQALLPQYRHIVEQHGQFSLARLSSQVSVHRGAVRKNLFGDTDLEALKGEKGRCLSEEQQYMF